MISMLVISRRVVIKASVPFEYKWSDCLPASLIKSAAIPYSTWKLPPAKIILLVRFVAYA